jgi:hypothetical protein
MISTPTAVAATEYPAYVYNCLRNVACERSYSAPLPGVPYLQTYVDFGAEKPETMEWTLVDTCTGDTEQIVPSNYVIGQTPEGRWYGVFKYFNSPVTPVTTFVVHLSVFVDAGGPGLSERTFFTEMLMVEPCDPLMKIKTCQPEQATTTGFDLNGIYYGLPVNLDYLGIAEVRFFHIAYVRQGKVRELSNKATFKSSLYRNFRTTVEKIFQIETELVPRWYKDVLLAIYARGAVQINDATQYLVSDINFEALNDDDLTWKPFAQLKETVRLFFGCDDSECIECCSPIVLDAFTTGPGGGGESSVAPSSEAPSSVPPPCLGNPIEGTPGATEMSVCLEPLENLFLDPAHIIIQPGATLYYDQCMTMPVLGFPYIKDAGGTIYNLDIDDATVGSPTGNSC